MMAMILKLLPFFVVFIEASQHFYPTYDQIPHPVKLNHHQNIVKREIGFMEGPMRIKVFFHKSVDDLRKKDRDIVKKVVSSKNNLKSTQKLFFVWCNKLIFLLFLQMSRRLCKAKRFFF